MAKRATRGLRKRNGVWHIQKRVRGYGTLYESTGTADLEEAERRLARRLEDIRKATTDGERPVVTFREAAEKFIRENSHLRSLDRSALAFDNVMPFIGALRLDRVHNDTLEGFKEARSKEGIKAGTINRDLDSVRRVLTLAARVWRHPNGMAYLDTAPLLMREQGQARRPYPLEWDEQERFVNELPPHLRDMAL